MADVLLTNEALISGLYDGDSVDVNTDPITTTIVQGLTAVKEADKDKWVDGYLLYTITLTNEASFPLTNAVFYDTLDVTKIVLVANSVKINNVAAPYNYNYITGLLTVVLPDVAVSETMVITFQVEKI